MISEQNSHYKHNAQRACLSTDPRCHPALHNISVETPGQPQPAQRTWEKGLAVTLIAVLALPEAMDGWKDLSQE